MDYNFDSSNSILVTLRFWSYSCNYSIEVLFSSSFLGIKFHPPQDNEKSQKGIHSGAANKSEKKRIQFYFEVYFDDFEISYHDQNVTDLS